MKRILVIRGGAIGDFILTLPALKLLRDQFPDAHIEILGYKHIIALAENRFYANAIRSIDYGPLSRFFARAAELPADLVEYFGRFDVIVSYLFDPDEIFTGNLKRCAVRQLITSSPKFNDREHATLQLAAPLQQLGLCLTDPGARLFLNESDHKAAAEFLEGIGPEIMAIHPGSGSERKNWPIESWIALGDALLNERPPRLPNPRRDALRSVRRIVRRRESRRSLVVVSGEADQKRIGEMREMWKNNSAVRFATNLPLPHLGAVLENVVFIGHDSGISHLAAAAGAKCILFFGPTDPAIWAPLNRNVKVLRAPDRNMRELDFSTVRNALTMWERP